jgi:Fe-S-cluster containining protein
MNLQLPDNVRQLSADEEFNFSCHPQVDCFTDCCRELELALMPYDVLRLSRILDITTAELLEQYCLIECEADDIFPRVYLGMVDDGRASCPFVSKKGCAVYEGRPGACRTYPLGRAASRNISGRCQAFHVLLTEPHCHGFAEPVEQTIARWTENQGLEPYNQFNDMLMTITQHISIQNDMRLTREQQQLYVDTLYDLDGFCARNRARQDDSDDELMTNGIKWLRNELFG